MVENLGSSLYSRWTSAEPGLDDGGVDPVGNGRAGDAVGQLRRAEVERRVGVEEPENMIVVEGAVLVAPGLAGKRGRRERVLEHPLHRGGELVRGPAGRAVGLFVAGRLDPLGPLGRLDRGQGAQVRDLAGVVFGEEAVDQRPVAVREERGLECELEPVRGLLLDRAGLLHALPERLGRSVEVHVGLEEGLTLLTRLDRAAEDLPQGRCSGLVGGCVEDGRDGRRLRGWRGRRSRCRSG